MNEIVDEPYVPSSFVLGILKWAEEMTEERWAEIVNERQIEEMIEAEGKPPGQIIGWD